jgi:hypothetical protein
MVDNAIAAILSQASPNSALVTLATKVNTNSADIAAIQLDITNNIKTKTALIDINTSLSTYMTSATSGFISKSYIQDDTDGYIADHVASATAEMYSKTEVDNMFKDDQGNTINLAALKTSVDSKADTATVTALANTTTTIEGKVQTLENAGFVARTGLGTAVSELFASSGDGQSPDAKASVVALVRERKSSLNLNADDVNINGYLNGGNASFVGDVQADQFVTGAANESGIGVMSTQFDPSTANINKAYFAPDLAQGGAITMWFYQSGEWKRIDLSQIAFT